MATTTPNYGWPVPTSTDYVKDGASSIEALGDAIDATVFGLGAAGLTLVKTQTIGTAVTNVAVTGAFSATYDNYLIIVAGGVGTTETAIGLQLGATTTGYYGAAMRVNYSGTTSTDSNNNAASWIHCGRMSTDNISVSANLQNPYLTKDTIISGTWAEAATGGLGAIYNGFLNNTTSYTGFTVIPATGNITGGTIRVYGYKNS
jgi:hypothetical protein